MLFWIGLLRQAAIWKENWGLEIGEVLLIYTVDMHYSQCSILKDHDDVDSTQNLIIESTKPKMTGSTNYGRYKQTPKC